MTTDYDPIAEQYKRSKLQPWRMYIESFTLMSLMGDASGKTVVDLANFDQCRIEGGMIPSALFNTLMVHPDFRRQGVARRLSEWRMEQARLRLGDKGVMMADIQMGNKASDRTVKKW